MSIVTNIPLPPLVRKLSTKLSQKQWPILQYWLVELPRSLGTRKAALATQPEPLNELDRLAIVDAIKLGENCNE